MRQLRQSSLHLQNKRLVAGRFCAAHLEAEHRLHILELSNRSLRQDSASLAKHVTCWRREAKRARADLQLAEQDNVKHVKKSFFFLVARWHSFSKLGLSSWKLIASRKKAGHFDIAPVKTAGDERA